MAEHRAQIRERQLRARLESKRKEQALEEVYDKMVNPHLYGTAAGGGGGYRKLRKGEHYEDVQKEFLENEIRIRERRKKYERPPPDHDDYRHHHYRDYDHRDRGRDHYHRDQPPPRHYRRWKNAAVIFCIS